MRRLTFIFSLLALTAWGAPPVQVPITQLPTASLARSNDVVPLTAYPFTANSTKQITISNLFAGGSNVFVGRFIGDGSGLGNVGTGGGSSPFVLKDDGLANNLTNMVRVNFPPVVAPATTVTTASGGAGSVTSEGVYRVTFITDTGESSPSTDNGTGEFTSELIEVSSIPTSSDSRVTGRRLYRRKSDGYFYLVTTISDNTTTTYNDNTPDASLGNVLPEHDSTSAYEYIGPFRAPTVRTNWISSYMDEIIEGFDGQPVIIRTFRNFTNIAEHGGAIMYIGNNTNMNAVSIALMNPAFITSTVPEVPIPPRFTVTFGGTNGWRLWQDRLTMGSIDDWTLLQHQNFDGNLAIGTTNGVKNLVLRGSNIFARVLKGGSFNVSLFGQTNAINTNEIFLGSTTNYFHIRSNRLELVGPINHSGNFFTDGTVRIGGRSIMFNSTGNYMTNWEDGYMWGLGGTNVFGYTNHIEDEAYTNQAFTVWYGAYRGSNGIVVNAGPRDRHVLGIYGAGTDVTNGEAFFGSSTNYLWIHTNRVEINAPGSFLVNGSMVLSGSATVQGRALNLGNSTASGFTNFSDLTIDVYVNSFKVAAFTNDSDDSWRALLVNGFLYAGSGANIGGPTIVSNSSLRLTDSGGTYKVALAGDGSGTFSGDVSAYRLLSSTNGSTVNLTNGTLQVSNNLASTAGTIAGSNVFQIDNVNTKKTFQHDTNGVTTLKSNLVLNSPGVIIANGASITNAWVRTVIMGGLPITSLANAQSTLGAPAGFSAAIVGFDQRIELAPSGGYLSNFIVMTTNAPVAAGSNIVVTIMTNTMAAGASAIPTLVDSSLTTTFSAPFNNAITNSGTASIVLPTSSQNIWSVKFVATTTSALISRPYAWSVEWWHQSP